LVVLLVVLPIVLQCDSKTRLLWNGTARNFKDQFLWYLAEIFKIL